MAESSYNAAMISSSNKQIEVAISAILDEEVRTWSQLAALIIAVHEGKYWEGKSDSFSKWLDEFGKNIGCGMATLWRYFSVGRKYNNLRKSAAFRGLEYPPLEELQKHVSAENFELLEKISRVVDEEDIYLTMDEILAGTIRRKELRERWNAFKPALEGQTARGNISTPKVDRKNQTQLKAIMKAKILDALRKLGPSWLNVPKPIYYQLLSDVVAEGRIKVGDFANPYQPIYYAPGLVALVKETKSSPMVVHGIEISLQLTPAKMKQLHEMSRYCNVAWLIIPETISELDSDLIPEDVGVLGFKDNGEFVIITEPSTDSSPSHIDHILKGIILKGAGV